MNFLFLVFNILEYTPIISFLVDGLMDYHGFLFIKELSRHKNKGKFIHKKIQETRTKSKAKELKYLGKSYDFHLFHFPLFNIL